MPRSGLGDARRDTSGIPVTQPDQVKVITDHLHATAADFRNIADQSKRQMDQFDLQQGAVSAQESAKAGDFSALQAIRACEQSWNEALEVFAAKLAIAGDKIDQSADTYAKSDQQATQALLDAGRGLR